MKTMTKRLVVVCALALSPGALAEEGSIVRSTQLAAAPYVDAASRGVLRAAAAVEIVRRDGGWYEVKTDDGRTGWVRLSNVRLGESAADEEGGFWASLFSFTGRSQTRTASATTGIRGLSEEDIANAEPNDAAVARLAAFAANDAETQRFAADIGLEARDVKPLDEKPVAGGGK